eukprot:gene12124-5615_t
MEKVLFITLLLLLSTLIFAEKVPTGNFIFAGRTKQETRVVEFAKQIKALETLMDSSPQLSDFSITLQNRTFGQVVLQIVRPQHRIQILPRQWSSYTRVLKGSLFVSGPRENYILKKRDGILFGPGTRTVAPNHDTKYTTLIHVHSTSDNKMKVPVSMKQSDPLQKIEKSSKTSKTDLNMGRLFVYGKSEVDINKIGQKLIDQNVRLTSQLLAHDRGMSAIMFVLRGVSGCHKHTKSDYMSWNGFGAAHHDMLLPNKFDTDLNDVVLMPWEYEHNLVSHKAKKDEVNVMIMVQYPEQLTSDATSVSGCT